MAALAVSGCGFGPVDVEPFEVDPAAADTCAAVLQDLPEVVGDAVRRDVEPESLPAAAWGEPAIVLRCGVNLPAAYEPGARLLEVDGIGWFPEPGDGGMFFTSTDREVLVEVAVPDDYAPEGELLHDLAPAIASHIPERELR
ncbi:DUF3515 domain-containing protein [Phytoactinopolyspora halophila]|uniref:DUF3515 domain-containing protein n=1 Tax=Phytoactinopolyspora halophila TaxID=1981511 RepID=UPI001314A566|nr:DUF3515 domain-containing protein [Phytoactinopolyspora halophila]